MATPFTLLTLATNLSLAEDTEVQTSDLNSNQNFGIQINLNSSSTLNGVFSFLMSIDGSKFVQFDSEEVESGLFLNSGVSSFISSNALMFANAVKIEFVNTSGTGLADIYLQIVNT